MTTEAQRAASRRNAEKSTGPRTEAGKRRVSRNAVTHGLDCTGVLLPEESAAELAQYRASMIADHAPQGAEEQDLVERMVAAHWRLRRLWANESGVHVTQRSRRPNPDFAGPTLLGDLQEERGFAYLDRKEAHLERTYHRCSVRLQVLQDLRRKGLRPEVVEEAVEPSVSEAAPTMQAEVVASTDEGSAEIAEQSRQPEAREVIAMVIEAPLVIREDASDSADARSGEIAEQSWAVVGRELEEAEWVRAA